MSGHDTRLSLPVQDNRLSCEFQRRLGRYMGEYDPSNAFATMYASWYKDHTGGRSDWFRADLVKRLEHTRSLAGRTVLDFGCGTGSSSVVLSENGAKVIGVDTEQVNLEVAIQRARDIGVEERCLFVRIPYLDVRRGALPFDDESFDLCTLIGVLEHVKPNERIACTAEIGRVLKRGGDLFIYDTPNRAHPKDYHTTRLWFVGWMPEGLAWKYAVLRRRFDVGQDFQRRGGNGVSRNELDRLFPADTWGVTYEKSVEEVANEFSWLVSGSKTFPSFCKKGAERWVSLAAMHLLKVVKLLGCRPTYWAANHTLGFTKL